MLTNDARMLLEAVASGNQPQAISEVVTKVAEASAGTRQDLVRVFLTLAVDGYVAEAVPPGEVTADRYVLTERGLGALR